MSDASGKLPASDQGVPGVSPGGPGHRLREAREAAGLSPDAVAAQLRLSARQVCALEAESFDELPGRTFVRGFIRNYARLVKLDPGPLLAHAADRLDAPVLRPINEGIGVLPGGQSHAPSWQKWAIISALSAALLAGAGYEWWQSEVRKDLAADSPAQTTAAPIPPANESASAPRTESLPLPTPASAGTPAAGGEEAARGGGTGSVPPAMPPSGTRASGATPSISEPLPASLTNTLTGVAPAKSALPRTSTTMPPKAPAAAGKIGLAFSEACWVEIREEGGRMLLSQRFAAGQQTMIEGSPPFDLVIGNAAVAKLSYDGKAVDLSPHARQNVARLRLP